MPVFESLDFWRDETPRTGAENMAVDQLLMEQIGDRPLLRIYEWSEPTVTFGYFLPLSDATDSFSDDELTYVRRWTGGGVVDHRIDITYTLVIPRSHELATARGAESYRVIHQALADTLGLLGEQVRLTVVDEGDGAAACFSNPVAYDLTNMSGAKVAGAGQRRTKYGLLHQGSVITVADRDRFAPALVRVLSDQASAWAPPLTMQDDARELAIERYAEDAWLRKKD
jgi:lipoate-protein ligase A